MLHHFSSTATDVEPYTVFTWLGQWGSLSIAALALGVSFYNLWKARPARVNWTGRLVADHWGGTRPGLRVRLIATNEGPATAERISWQVKMPGEPWSEVRDGRPQTHPVVERGKEVAIVLANLFTEGELDRYHKPTGVAKVRMIYRRLPRTDKPRRAVIRANLDSLDI